MTRALHRDISLQVATDANRIPQPGIELRRVNHHRLAAGHEVLSSISVTTLAGDTCMEKGQRTIAIDCAGIAMLYPRSYDSADILSAQAVQAVPASWIPGWASCPDSGKRS